MANPLPAGFLNFPIVDPKTGKPSIDFLRFLQNLLGQTANLNLNGTLDGGSGGQIVPAVLAGQVANLDANGVVLPAGVDMSRAYINKFLNYIPDGGGRYSVTAVDASNKALIDFSQAGHSNLQTLALGQSPVTVATDITNQYYPTPSWNGQAGNSLTLPGIIEFDVYSSGKPIDVLLYASSGGSGPNGYFLRFDPRLGSNAGQLLVVTNGSWSNIGTAKASTNSADLIGWHNVKVMVSAAGRYDIFVDGVWQCTATDTTYSPTGATYFGYETSTGATIAPAGMSSNKVATETVRSGAINTSVAGSNTAASVTTTETAVLTLTLTPAGGWVEVFAGGRFTQGSTAGVGCVITIRVGSITGTIIYQESVAPSASGELGGIGAVGLDTTANGTYVITARITAASASNSLSIYGVAANRKR